MIKFLKYFLKFLQSLIKSTVRIWNQIRIRNSEFKDPDLGGKLRIHRIRIQNNRY
jgi:hypothetical protein